MSDPRSQALLERARASTPSGANSPVRAFKTVGGEPLFIARAKGAWVYNESGGEYVDYIGSWGPAILRRAQPDMARSVAGRQGRAFLRTTQLNMRIVKLSKRAALGQFR